MNRKYVVDIEKQCKRFQIWLEKNANVNLNVTFRFHRHSVSKEKISRPFLPNKY